MDIKLISDCCSSRCDFGIENDTRDDRRSSGVRVYTCWLMIWLSNTFGYGTVKIKNDLDGTFVHVSRDSLDKWLARRGHSKVESNQDIDYENAIVEVVKARIKKKDTPESAAPPPSAPPSTPPPPQVPATSRLPEGSSQFPGPSLFPPKPDSLTEMMSLDPRAQRHSLFRMLSQEDSEKMSKEFPQFGEVIKYRSATTPIAVSEIEGKIKDPRILIFLGMDCSLKPECLEKACNFYLAAARKSVDGQRFAKTQFEYLNDSQGIKFFYLGQLFEIMGTDGDLRQAIIAYDNAFENGCKMPIPSYFEIVKKMKNPEIKIVAYELIANCYKRRPVVDYSILNECYEQLRALGETKALYHRGLLYVQGHLRADNPKVALENFMEVVKDPKAKSCKELYGSMQKILILDRKAGLDLLQDLFQNNRRVFNMLIKNSGVLHDLAQIPGGDPHPFLEIEEVAQALQLHRERLEKQQSSSGLSTVFAVARGLFGTS